MWQDYVITIGGFTLIASLLTSVVLKDRWYVPNALILGGVLFVYGIAFATMSMWLSSSVMFGQSVLWTTIALQKCTRLGGIRTGVGGMLTRLRRVGTHRSGTTTLTGGPNES